MTKTYLTFEEKVQDGVFTVECLKHMKTQFQEQLDTGKVLSANTGAMKAKIRTIDQYIKQREGKTPAELVPKSGEMIATTNKVIALDVQPVLTRDNSVTDEDVARKFLQVKESARSRGIEFGLNLTTVRNLMKAKRCAYTGLPYDYSDPQKSPSFDRKDYKKGYIKGNVVSCRKDVNELKNVLIEHPASVFKDNIQLLSKVVKAWGN